MKLLNRIKFAFRVKKYEHDDSTTWSMDRSTLKPLSFYVRVGWTKKRGDWWALYPGEEKFFHASTYKWTKKSQRHYRIFFGRAFLDYSLQLRWRR